MRPGFKEIQGRPAFGFVANGGGDLTVLVFVLMIIPFFLILWLPSLIGFQSCPPPHKPYFIYFF